MVTTALIGPVPLAAAAFTVFELDVLDGGVKMPLAEEAPAQPAQAVPSAPVAAPVVPAPVAPVVPVYPRKQARH